MTSRWMTSGAWTSKSWTAGGACSCNNYVSKTWIAYRFELPMSVWTAVTPKDICVAKRPIMCSA